jgi:transposase-like protein
VRAYKRTSPQKEKSWVYSSEYRASERGKAKIESYREKHRASTRRWLINNREKKQAQTAVATAIEQGKLTRGACEMCGSGHRVHGHHDSYAKEDWLNVRWLCQSCHLRLHALSRQ